MRIDWWTLGLQTVNVLILVAILARFLFRPVIAIMDERRAAAAKVLARRRGGEGAGGRGARGGRGRERQDRRRPRRRAAPGRGGGRRPARGGARRRAKAEADQVRAAAETEIALGARRRGGRGLRPLGAARGRRRRASSSERLPEQARVDGFVDGLAAALASLPEASRDGFGARDKPTLTAPRPLTAAETASLPRRLRPRARAAGRFRRRGRSGPDRRARARDAARGRAQQLSRGPQTHRRGVDPP